MNNLLKTILLETKKEIFLNNFALVNSKFGGDGLEFLDIKEYSSSDSVRYLNATATAKAQKPYVNIFQKELDIKVVIVVLVSATMLYKNKIDKLKEIVTALSFIAINTKNSLETLFFSSKVEKFFKATKNSKAVIRNYQILNELDFRGKKIDFNSLKETLMYQKKSAKVFIIGDFLHFDSIVPTNLKHDISFVLLRDKTEESLDFFGDKDIVSLEDNSILRLNIDKKMQKQYQKKFKIYDNSLLKEFKSMKTPYIKIYTDDKVVFKIRELLCKI